MAEAALSPIERVSSDSIRLERLLEAPPGKVWDYLTKAELREQWFMGGTDARPQSEFELLVDHDKLSEEEVPYPDTFECFKGRVFCEKVLKFDPPRLLETTFQEGKGGIVTYELFAEGGKTRLVLTHSGITDPSGFRGFGGGWTSHLTVLQEKLAGRSVKNFWVLHAECRDAVAKALG